MKENVKKAYQSGAFEPFMEVVEEVATQSMNIKFEPDPYKNAYNMGKADMAKTLVEEVESQIIFYCK